MFRKTFSLALALVLTVSLFSGLSLTVNAADVIWQEDPTGYTKASDVVYVKDGTKVANWGVRGEVATFLTSYAEAYYTDGYTFETLSANQGNAATGSTPQSALYKALQGMLKSKQTSTTSYAGTRELYKYTDCMVGNYSNISSFYSGRKLKGAWDSGSTWNREHTWPNSKISGNGENDIMMLRPTSVQENSDRGNKAYGESESCYDPNVEATPNGFNVRGDCARIILYVYVRWGETSDVLNNMWGSSGVMESLDILLKWMAEDPVDTWELGRNDAVQSITGVRNVFVDYPEYAWLLFGQSVPAGYPTPSGSALGGEHVHDYQAVVTEPTCTEQGYTTYTCTICGDSYVDDYTAALGHNWGEWTVITQSNCARPGQRSRTCTRCGATETIETEISVWDHDWGYPTYEWAADYSSCTGTCVCQNDASHILTMTTTQISIEIDEKPTTEKEGLIRYVAFFESNILDVTFIDVVIPKLEPGEMTFDDVPADAYYAEPVAWAVEHGVTQGTGDGKFSPGKTCTRSQVVTFLWRAFGQPEPTVTTHSFTDVDAGKFYYTAMLWALETGITTGTGSTTFSPDRSCSRGQVVTFLWRAKGKPAAVSTTDENELPIVTLDGGTLFTDILDGAYYYQAVLWAVSAGVTTGTSATTFSPDRPCTRGQVVTFLCRAVSE